MFAQIAQWVSDKIAGKPTVANDGSRRSSHWPAVRRAHLAKEPACQWCGATTGLIEVHHMQPFHLHPELELMESNFITLCESSPHECHFKIGHNGTSWKDYNQNVRMDCQLHIFSGGVPPRK